MLGNGMYNVQKTQGRYTKFEGSFGVPKMIAELRLGYADGKAETIGTDAEWKVARGPVTFSSTYGGEDFDARKVQAGWDRAGFDGCGVGGGGGGGWAGRDDDGGDRSGGAGDADVCMRR